MNESSFSLTNNNNVFKLSGIVEASFGCCDSITLEQVEVAKLGSCSCGWVRGAFGCKPYSPALFLFLGTNFLAGYC